MKKRLLVLLSSISLLITGCLGAQNYQYKGALGPILRIADSLLIRLPQNMDSNIVLIKFLIWMLVFAFVFTGINKVFNKDGKHRGSAIAISFVISVMGVAMIPNNFVKRLFELYSNVFIILLILGPAILTSYIIHSTLKGDSITNRILRPVLAWTLVWAYSSLTVNSIIYGIGSNQASIESYLQWGIGAMTFIAFMYTIKAFGELAGAAGGGWGGGGGGGDYRPSGKPGLLRRGWGWLFGKGSSDSAVDTSTLTDAAKQGSVVDEKLKAAEDLVEADKKVEANLEEIKTQLIGVENNAVEELEPIRKDLDSILAVLNDGKYTSHIKHPKVAEYLKKVFTDLNKRVKKFDQDKVEIKARGTKITDAFQKLSDSHDWLVNDSTLVSGAAAQGKSATITTKIAEALALVKQAQKEIDDKLKEANDLEDAVESRVVNGLNSAIHALTAETPNIEEAKSKIKEARAHINQLEELLKNLEQFLSSNTGKYLAKIKEMDDELSAAFKYEESVRKKL